SVGLGALKSNVGHMEATAGIGGVIKVLLAMRNRILPSNLNFSKLNPRIDLDRTPFYIIDDNKPWIPRRDKSGNDLPLRAGVSSFGMGGVSSHIILEYPLATELTTNDLKEIPAQYNHEENLSYLLSLSAQSSTSLQSIAQRYESLLSSAPGRIADICYLANTTRTQMEYRFAVTANNDHDLQQSLQAYASNRVVMEGASYGRVVEGRLPLVGFLFTGQGAQYIGMGRGLYESQPIFREALDRCNDLVEPQLGRSLHDLFYQAGPETLSRTRYTQPAIFSIDYALAQLWKSFGITPDVVMGHSVGEIVAACIAGVFSLEDALRLVVKRGHLIDSLEFIGAMVAVRAGVDKVTDLLAEKELVFDIAAINGPESTVISGDERVIKKVAEVLESSGIDVSLLDVSQGFHSSLMDPILDEFLKEVEQLNLCLPNIDLVSNVTGTIEKDLFQDPQYWVNHIRKPVMFKPSVERMQKLGVDLFLELGPSAVLTTMARHCLSFHSNREAKNPDSAQDILCVSSLKPGTADNEHFMQSLATLYTAGLPVDFSALKQRTSFQPITLPTYPFQRQRHWVSSKVKHTAVESLIESKRLPLLGKSVEIALEGIDYACYESIVLYDLGEFLKDHQVCGISIMPLAGYVCLAFAAAMKVAAGDQISQSPTLSELVFLRPLHLTDGSTQVQIVLQRNSANEDWQIRFSAKHSESEEWAIYARGRLNWVSLSEQESSSSQTTIDLTTNNPLFDSANFYQQCTAKGLQYGTEFQVVDDVVSTENDSVLCARIKLPKPLAAAWMTKSEGSEDTLSTIHPALLDGALQLAVSSVFEHDSSNRVPLPVAIERLSIYSAIYGELTAECRLRPLAEENQAHRIADILLYNERGKFVVDIEGIKIVWVNAKSIADTDDTKNKSNAEHPTLSYTPQWIEDKTTASALTPLERVVPRGGVLIVYTTAAALLKDKILDHYDMSCQEILLGPTTSVGTPQQWCFDPLNPASLTTIVQNISPFDALYFLGGIQSLNVSNLLSSQAGHENRSEFISHQENILEHCLTDSVITLFNLLKAFRSNGLINEDSPLNITTVTNGLYQVSSEENTQPNGGPVAGFVKSIGKEYPRWTVNQVDIALADPQRSSETLSGIAGIIIRETDRPENSEVALRVGRSFRRVLKPFTPVLGNQQSPYIDNGCYLIAGGVGGIGFALACYLAEHFSARLVLLGRSELGEHQQEQIRQIESLGGEALYLQADIADSLEFSTAVKIAKKRFGTFNGAIHSAGLIQDSTLENMEESSLRAVMTPKVSGSLSFYQALADESLDFMLFFSSMVSLLAPRGQSNYVAANAFEDSFARAIDKLANFPVRTINWGFWAEVGMASDDNYRRHIARQGFKPLSVTEGIQAIERVLKSAEPQVVVLKAELSVLAELGVDPLPKSIEGPAEPIYGTAELPTMEQLMALSDADASLSILNSLEELIAKVLQIDMQRELEGKGSLADMRLTSLGIDSLTATDLRSQIRNWVQVDLPPEIVIGGGRISEIITVIRQKVLIQRMSQRNNETSTEDENVEVFVL
ncbi:MAG: SDR family NAD(P)-dependent oxidoreductase, partial [Pseudomonadales bacterium]